MNFQNMDFRENKTDSATQKFFRFFAFLKVFTSAILLLAVKKKKKPDEMEDIY